MKKSMDRIQNTRYYSKCIGGISEGCRLCVRGRKLVLFVTGLCSRRCYYCPLSEQKKNRDVIFANERPVTKDSEIIDEAEISQATSASITGGDPLVVLERTIHYIKLLKRRFGKNFHIHLYAPLELVSDESLKRLYDSGLDEIRFHPDLENRNYWDRIKLASVYDWDVGIEIPAIPGEEKRIKELIDYSEDFIKFLNLNELEISDTNAGMLLLRKFVPKDRVSYAVRGSEQTALKIMKYCLGRKFSVHYCTAKLKDAVQLANRIKLRAKKSAEKFDITTEEGLLIRGAIYLPELKPDFEYKKRLEGLNKTQKRALLRKLEGLRKKLISKYNIPESLIKVDTEKPRIITALPIVEEIAREIRRMGALPARVKQYPTFDQMEVDVEFL